MVAQVQRERHRVALATERLNDHRVIDRAATRRPRLGALGTGAAEAGFERVPSLQTQHRDIVGFAEASLQWRRRT